MSNENMHMPNAIRFDQKSNFEIWFQKVVSFVGLKTDCDPARCEKLKARYTSIYKQPQEKKNHA